MAKKNTKKLGSITKVTKVEKRILTDWSIWERRTLSSHRSRHRRQICLVFWIRSKRIKRGKNSNASKFRSQLVANLLFASSASCSAFHFFNYWYLILSIHLIYACISVSSFASFHLSKCFLSFICSYGNQWSNTHMHSLFILFCCHRCFSVH